MQQKTLIITNLPEDIQEVDLDAKFSNIGQLKRCFINRTKGKTKVSNGFVTFLSSGDAKQALNEVVTIKGHKIKAELLNKNYDQNLPSKYKKFRLIVRNLPFDATILQLRSTFSPHGTILDIQMPKKHKSSNKGYAFIQYENSDQAQKAIKEINGTTFNGRILALDWSISKTQYTELLNKDVQDNVEKEMYEKVLDKIKPPKKHREDLPEQMKNQAKLVSSVEEQENEKPKLKISKLFNKRDQSELDDKRTLFVRNIPNNATQEEFKQTFQKLGTLEYALLVTINGGKMHRGTGFVRFVSSDDASNCLKQASGVNVCNSIPSSTNNNKDSTNTNRSKKFTDFLFGHSAYDDEDTSITDPPKFKIVDKASSDNISENSNNDGIYMHGQRLSLCLAVNRDELNDIMQRKEKFKQNKYEDLNNFTSSDPRTIESGIFLNDNETDKKFREKDKRNLHLLDEASIKRCSKRYGGTLSQSDLNKRAKLMASNKTKLKLLHFFVSPTRLTIHNLPKWIDNRLLRLLFQKSLNDPTAKIIEARVMLDLSRATLKQPKDQSNSNKTDSDKTKKNSAAINKYKPSTVKAPSLCYGFVEFATHIHALRALRLLDNNPKAYEPMFPYIHKSIKASAVKESFETRRPIIQFAISNKLALNARALRQERFQKTQNYKKAFDIKQPTQPIVVKPTPITNPNTEFRNQKNSQSKNDGSTKRKLAKPQKKTKKPKIAQTENLEDEDDEVLAKKFGKVHKKLFAKVGSQFV